MSKTKTFFIILLVIIAAVLVYSFVSKTPTPVGTLSTTPQSGQAAQASAVGGDFLSILLNLKKIKLDDTILTRDSFTSLQDFTKVIPPEGNPGRPNPFAPIGTDASTPSAFPTTVDVFAPDTGEATPLPASKVSTASATSITKTGAILNGSLSQGGSTTTRWFEWGTAATALSSTSPATVQAAAGTFTRTVTNLSPGTTYYFRAVATIAGVRVTGETKSFTTLTQ